MLGAISSLRTDNTNVKEKLNDFIEAETLEDTLKTFNTYKEACITKLENQENGNEINKDGNNQNINEIKDTKPIDLSVPEDDSWKKLPEFIEVEEVIKDDKFTVKTKEPWKVFDNLKKASIRSIPHLRPMWKGLENHFVADEYRKSSKIFEEIENKKQEYQDDNSKIYPQERNILIVGAGPAGLRMAIEAAFLKFNNIVIAEKEEHFSRNEILEAWPFDLIDLRDLGVRDIYREFGVHGHDIISTKRLQLCLLKIALILGVRVYTKSEYKYVKRFDNKNSPYFTAIFETEYEDLKNYQFNILVDASGPNSNILSEFNFEKQKIDGIHEIGVTANFNTDTNITNLDKIKYTPLEHGVCQIQLSNVTYNKDETHYILATPQKTNLLETGVIIENKDSLEELLDPDNINYDILATYLRRVADKCRIPATCLLTISEKTNKPNVGIYNLSERHCSNKPSTFLIEPYEYVAPKIEKQQKIIKKVPNQERIQLEKIYNARMLRRKEMEMEIERKRKEEEARRKAEEEARRKAEEEARRKAEEEARKKAEEEAKRKAEEEAKRKAEEEAKKKAELEARKKKDEEMKKKAEEENARRISELKKRNTMSSPIPRPLSRNGLININPSVSKVSTKPKDFPSKNLSGLVSKRMSFFAQVSDDNGSKKNPVLGKRISKLNMKKWETMNQAEKEKPRPGSSLDREIIPSSKGTVQTWSERQKALEKQKAEEKRRKDELLRKGKEEDEKLIKVALEEEKKKKEAEKERLRLLKEEEERNHVKVLPKEFEKEALEINHKKEKQKANEELEAARLRREAEYAKAEEQMKKTEDNKPKKALFVAMVGDSLLEPIWEQNNGLAYSSLSAMDLAWIIQMLGEPEKWSFEATESATLSGPSLLTKHEKMYWQLLACTSDNIQRQERYSIDPLTRYDRVGKRMKIEHQKIVAKLMAEKYPATPMTRNSEKRISLWTTPGQ